MSFSFSFNARTKHAARQLADAQRRHPQVPRAVVDLVQDAVDRLPEDAGDSGVIMVTAHGHVADARSSSTSADVVISVKRIAVDG
ncbi:MAG: hypothetical protein J0H94_03775 [Rhizobiales bacterium]|nr:hypothetical protein [Hyphomicrobiales bacterium]